MSRHREGEVRYLTDDRDMCRAAHGDVLAEAQLPPERDCNELAIFRGGNGDFYIGTMPRGEAGIGRFVRICLSGGVAASNPKLVRAVFDLFKAMGGEPS